MFCNVLKTHLAHQVGYDDDHAHEKKMTFEAAIRRHQQGPK